MAAVQFARAGFLLPRHSSSAGGARVRLARGLDSKWQCQGWGRKWPCCSRRSIRAVAWALWGKNGWIWASWEQNEPGCRDPCAASAVQVGQRRDAPAIHGGWHLEGLFFQLYLPAGQKSCHDLRGRWLEIAAAPCKETEISPQAVFPPRWLIQPPCKGTGRMRGAGFNSSAVNCWPKEQSRPLLSSGDSIPHF